MFQIISLFCLSSCANVAGLVSKPTYSLHSQSSINLSNFDKNSSIYIRESQNDAYNLYENVIQDVKKKLTQNGVKIVNNKELATHILRLNIRNISVDIDYNFANSVKNSLLSNEVGPEYIFDNGNSPHINSNFNLKNSNDKSISSRRMRLLPSVLYTTIGATTGFVGGWLLAGSLSPLPFGLLGAVVVGGTTYYLYDTFRATGVMITYEIIIEEKVNKQIKHSIKSLFQKSSNIADEVFYDYKDERLINTSKNIVLAIGSRALNETMVYGSMGLISNSVVANFQVN